MKKIFIIASFKLNDKNLLEDWKKFSSIIQSGIVLAEGFVSRDVVVADDGESIKCIIKWDSVEHQQNYMKFVEQNFGDAMAEFARIADFETMKKEVFEVLELDKTVVLDK